MNVLKHYLSNNKKKGNMSVCNTSKGLQLLEANIKCFACFHTDLTGEGSTFPDPAMATMPLGDRCEEETRRIEGVDAAEAGGDGGVDFQKDFLLVF